MTAQPKNFPTLGAKLSKYSDPETKVIKPYPNARLGFILASPVLLLNEGTRTVTITLSCSLDGKICEELSNLTDPVSTNCCDEKNQEQINTPVFNYPDFLPTTEIYSNIVSALKTEYYYISETLIAEAIKKGLDSKTVLALRNFLISSNKDVIPRSYCYCPSETKRFHTIVLSADFENEIDISSEIVSAFFKKRKPFQILFSGEKDWIDPGNSTLTSFEIVPNIFNNQFSFIIKTTINPDKPSVTFYSKETLKEDFDTKLPLVKIELDDHFKIFHGYTNQENKCCLDKDLKFENNQIPLSLYHFFRNVKIEKDSKIDVQVCRLKNFIVQNDESLQDVNGPVYPFGVRPKVESNFYIGSEEIFLKKWADIIININWKDLPPVPTSGDFIGQPFKAYYNGYQDFYITAGVQDKVVEDDKFRVQIAILQDGKWIYRTPLTGCGALTDSEWALFQKEADVIDIGCADDKNYSHQFAINNKTDFAPPFPNPVEEITFLGIKKYDVNSRRSFIRITLKCQDFQHDRYAFILARQMSAFGKLPDIVDGAVYYGVTIPGPPPVFTTLDLPVILQQIIDNYNLSLDAGPPAFDLVKNSRDLINDIISQVRVSGNVNAAIWNNLFLIDDPTTFVFGDPTPFPPPALPFGLNESNSFYYDRLSKIFAWLKNLKEKIEQLKDKGVVIPNEPWTPIISNMSLDYTATATIEDIDLIHLYPYAGTYSHEEIKLQPTLFPTFCDEGALFLGLKNLVPGNNLNLLFQLAEATSDSESEKQEVQWHYLDNNVWKPLRNGFEVLDDASENLTTSGIVKLALPANMTNDNTIMPKGLHWIKASVTQNSKAVSEATGIHPQAISVTFTNDDANDKLRLSEPLPAGSISKLNVADANVKSVQQPYETYGGEIPEIAQQFYVRVSEQLRHKSGPFKNLIMKGWLLKNSRNCLKPNVSTTVLPWMRICTKMISLIHLVM